MFDCCRFDLQRAAGPHRLDHGDVLYAPNVCTDGGSRLLLWAWLQERRAPGTAAAYAGCLTLPRLLSLAPTGEGGGNSNGGAGGDNSGGGLRLMQQPAPELTAPRRCYTGGHASNGSASGSGGWYAEGVEVAEGQLLPVEGVAGPQLDLELTFTR